MNEVSAGTPGSFSAQNKQVKKGSAYNDLQQQKKKTIGITKEGASKRHGVQDQEYYHEISVGNKKYTISPEEYHGVKDLYKTQWADHYGQDDEDQMNKASGAMPRSFANSYGKNDKNLYDLGLPNSKYFEKYLEAYRSARDEQKQIEAEYNAKNQRLNDFYAAVGTKWLEDETKMGNFNPDQDLAILDDLEQPTGETETWSNRRQKQFFDLLNSPEWADVRSMYGANKKSPSKPEGEYETPRDYYEALYKAEYQNKEFTEEQQAKSIYDVSFNFDDFNAAYNDNLRASYAREKFVDETTGLTWTGQDVFDIAGNVMEVNKARSNVKGWVAEYDGDDYSTLIQTLINGGADTNFIAQAKDTILETMKERGKASGKSNKERKAEKQAFLDSYDKLTAVEEAPDRTRLSKKTGEALPDISDWIEAETGASLGKDRKFMQWGGAGNVGAVTPDKLTDIFKKMEEEGYTDGEILKAHKDMLASLPFASQREKIEAEFYQNYDGGVYRYAANLANGFEKDGKTSSMSSQEVLSTISEMANSGKLTPQTLNDQLEVLKQANVSSAVLREAVNQYLSGAEQSGASGLHYRGDISQYVNDSNKDVLKAMGYGDVDAGSRSLTTTSSQELRDTLEKFVSDYETQQHSDLIESTRLKFGDRFDSFDIDQAFSRVGWADSIPIERRAMDYFVAMDYGTQVMSGDDTENAYRYYMMSDEDRKAESLNAWASMTPEERTAYIERFDLEKDFNPVLNKSYKEQIQKQFVGAWAKTALGLVKTAANLSDMANKWMMNSVSAEFIDDMGRERYEKYTQNRQNSIDTLRKTHAAVSMYGKAQGQDGLSDLISMGSDIMAEVMRMYTMNFIGGGIAQVVSKGIGATSLGAAAVNSDKIARGINRLVKIAGSSAFVSDAIGNYWEEAMQEGGATVGQATTYALICGTLEGAVEALNMDAIATGLLGGNRLADSLLRNGRLAMNSGFRAKCKLIGLVGSALGEGGEEGLSNIASTVVGNLTIRRNQFENGEFNLFKGFSWDEFWNDVKMGALIGLVANAASGANEFSPEYIICEKMMDKGFDPTSLQILHGMAVINSMDQHELADYRAHIQKGDLLNNKELEEVNDTLFNCKQQAKSAKEQFDATVANHQAEIKKVSVLEKRYATERGNALKQNDVKKATRKGELLAEATAKRENLEADFRNNLPKWQAAMDNQVAPFSQQYQVAEDTLKRHWVAFDSAMETYKLGLSKNKRATAVDLGIAENYEAAMQYVEKNGGKITFDDLANLLASAVGKADADENVAPVIEESNKEIQQGEELATAIREGGAEGAQAVEQAQAEAQAVEADVQAQAEQTVEEQQGEQPVAETPAAEQPTAEQPTEQLAEQPTAEAQTEQTAEAEQPSQNAGQFNNDGKYNFGKTEAQMRQENVKDGRIELNENERSEVDAFAQRFGKGIVWEVMDKDHNGYFNPADGKIHLNVYQASENNASYIEVGKITFIHELTHSLEKTKSYAMLTNLVKQAVCKQYGFTDPKMFDEKIVTAFRADYAAKGHKLTLSEARREVVASFIETNALATDANGAKTVKAFADFVARENSGLAGHIFNGITNLLSRIGRNSNPCSKMLYNSQKIWAKALKENGVDIRKSAEYAQPAQETQPVQTEQTATAEQTAEQPGNAPLKKLSKGTYETSDGGIVAQFSLAYAPRTLGDFKAEVDRLMKVSSDRAEAERWVRSQMSLAALVSTSDILNYDPDERYNSIKKNSDYKQGTVDFINDCIKRRPFSDMFAEVQRQNPDRVFNSTDLEAIRIILEQEGYPVGCVMCFVDDRRQNMGNRAQDFIDILNGNIPEGLNMNKTRTAVFDALKKAGVTYVPNIAELVNYKEFKELHDSDDPQKRAIYDAYNKFNNSFGMASVRLVEGDAEYRREILKWSPSKINKVNSLGGLRIFSFSDFEAHHLLDIVQIVQDCAQMGVKIQGYTKVPAFAKAVAATGLKVNRSHIAFGNGYHVDENGNYYINHDVRRDENGKIINPNDLDINVVEGIDPSDPDFIEANGNIGNNIIGISWEHILAAMADPYFHQIIPFHTGLDEARLVQKGIKHWFNFKRFQTEKDASTFSKKENGLYNFKKSKYQCNFYTDVIQPMERAGETITAQSFGERFIQVCEEHGAVPRFWQVLDEYVGEDGSLHYRYVPGYEKLLVDYPMFDADGNYIPQEAVKPNFDDEFNTSVLTKYVESEEKKRTPEELAKRQRTIDRITNEVVNGDSSQISKASDIDFDAEESSTPQIQHSTSSSLKSALDLNATFDTSDLDQFGMYYKSVRAIQNDRQGKYDINSLEKWMLGKGVKAEEIKWLGIPDYVQELKDKGIKSVTRQELLDYINANKLQITPIVHSDENISNLFEDLSQRRDEIKQQAISYLERRGVAIGEAYINDIENELARLMDSGDQEAKRYFDALSEIDNNESDLLDTLYEGDGIGAKWGDYAEHFQNPNAPYAPVLNNYKEILYTLPQSQMGSEEPWYYTPHWDEPNVIAHARMQDTESMSGLPVRFIDEFQSDLHQQGRDKGYKTNKTKEQKIKDEELTSEYSNLIKTRDEYRVEYDVAESALDNAIKKLGDNLASGVFDELENRVEEAGDLYMDAVSAVRQFEKDHPEYVFFYSGRMALREDLDNSKRPPEAPLGKNWNEFLVNASLMDAINNDMDYLAWTSGEMQGRRYGMEIAKNIDTLEYSKEASTLFFYKDGRYVGSQVVHADELQNYVGKEVAEKLLEASNPSGIVNVGDDFQVGAQGMHNFYDIGGKSKQNIPAYLKKVGKRFGVEPEMLELVNGDKVPAIRITDEMKQTIPEQGFPMFAVNTSNLWDSLGQQFGTYDNRSTRLREANTPKQRTDTQNTSKFFDNYLQNAKLTDEQIADAQDAYVTEGLGTYKVAHLNDYVSEAKGELASEGYDVAVDRMLRDLDERKVTPKLIVKGEQLLTDALAKGDNETALKLTAKLCVVSHEAGVSLNAFKALRQMSGVGQAAYITMLVDRLNNKTFADRIKKGKMPALHLDQSLLQDLTAAKTDAEINNALEAIFIDVGSQIPPTLGDALKAWRYTAMLGNPVTHIRNMTGNVLMGGVASIKDLVATGIERGFVKDSSQWSHAVYNPASAEHRAIREAAKDSWVVHKDAVQGSGKLSFESRIRNYARTSNIEVVNAVEKFVGNALEGEDAWSLKNAYVSAFTQYCIAQKLDPNNLSKADEARAVDYATLEAQKRTFRDPSWIASWISQAASAAEKNFLMEILIEGVLPFKKTPINILRRGIEYSPIGLMRGAFDALVNVRKGKVTAAQAVDEIASGFTGSMLFGLGMFLARVGALRAHGDDEDDYETFLEQTGDQQYALSLSLGGQKFSLALSQLAPAAIPLFMGASLAEGVDSDTGMSILTTMANAANPMMEMSFLSSLNQALTAYNGYSSGGETGLGALGAVGTSIAKSYASQYIPTLGGKIANIVDDTKRSQKGFKNSALGDASWDSYVRGLERKVPGLENTLEESVDVLGRTKQKTTFTDWLLSVANNLVLPANVNVVNRDEVDDALIDVFEMTGNKDILPTAPAKYLTKGSGDAQKRYDFTASEYTEYSKQYGQAVYSAIKTVMADKKYKNSTDWNEKADMLQKAVEGAEKTIKDMWKEEKLSDAPRSSGFVYNPATGGIAP